MKDTVATRLAEACPASRQHQATSAQLRQAGVGSTMVTRCLAEGALVRLRRGSYALSPLPARGRHLLTDGVVDPAYLAEIRAVLHSLGGGCVADRRTAAVLWKLDMLVEPKDVCCRLPRTQSRVRLPGVDARTSTATADDAVAVAGLEPVRVTTAVDTVLDCCLDRPQREAVVIADSALRRGVVDVDDLCSGVASRAAAPGARKLRRLLELIDPSSGSVLESVLRFLLVTHGLVPESQYVVLGQDGKRTIGRFDFFFLSARLIVECDGRRWHDPEDVRRKDRLRDNELERLRYRLLRFSWDEVLHSPGYVLQLVKDCLVPAAA